MTYFRMLALSFIFLSACSSFNPPVIAEEEVQFELIKSNSDSNFESEIASFEVVEESLNWTGNLEEEVQLAKYFNIDVQLKNEEQYQLGLAFRKNNVDPANLENIGADANGARIWSFASVKKSIDHFYGSPDQIEVTIGNNVVFFDTESANLDFSAFEGEGDTGLLAVLRLAFDANAYGWFDPQGEWSEVYEFKNATIQLLVQE